MELSQLHWWRYPFFHLFVIGSYGVEELWGGGVKELWGGGVKEVWGGGVKELRS